MNYVSFSLFGTDPKYHVGAIRNVEQIKRFYPGYVPLFFVGPGVPEVCIKKLEKAGAKFSGQDLSKLTYFETARPKWSLKMIRFLGIEEPDADIVLVRDVDSRFSERETNAVKQWLKSDKLFHVMRDYSGHNTTIMAGMWGWKKELGTLGMHDLVLNWYQDHRDVSDQHFLHAVIWPKIKHSVMQHDSFYRDKYSGAIPFPDGDKSVSGSFVGEVIDENEKPQKYIRQARRAGKWAHEIVWSDAECAKYE